MKTNFVETWLCETPLGIGPMETYSGLRSNIKDFINSGTIQVESLGNNYFKIDLGTIAFYWNEDNEGEIIIGVEIEKKPQGLIIRLLGKNSEYSGKPPYASNLYDLILKDTKRSIRLISDNKLSDEGIKLWRRLFSLGHKISVYNVDDPGQSFKTFTDLAELESFYSNNDISKSKYQYILSESERVLVEARCNFRTRRYRELAGIIDE